jgi:hypothetical protein
MGVFENKIVKFLISDISIPPKPPIYGKANFIKNAFDLGAQIKEMIFSPILNN